MTKFCRLNMSFSHFAISLSLASLATVALLSQSGCHRGFYRRQADVEAQRLILEKSYDPRWAEASDGTIQIDPQSRMFDPFSQDHPPIPPDDPESHRLMECVDGKPGYPHWHANGDTPFVENPEWRSYLPLNENGEVVLDLATAYQLALIHSPDLQRQKETLYLSALDVSLERFGFDAQMFTGFNSFLSTTGRIRNGGSSSTTLTTADGANSGGTDLRKLGISGATFAAGLANSIMWNFAGPNSNSVTSLIDFSVIQPLLRNAGRERILESLTQAERTLLANVRQLDRFRRGFYLQIITGRNPGAGPNLSGNFLGAPSGASASVGGYLGLLQQQQQIRIQEFNVGQLEDVLVQLREFFRRERIDSLQLRQFENDVYNAQQSLLRAKTQYQDSLDLFKRTLGLPPDLEVVIRDDFLNRFEFISDEITQRQNNINELRTQTGEQLSVLDSMLPPEREMANDFPWPDSLDENIALLQPFIERAIEYLDRLQNQDRAQIESDFDRLEEIRPRRVAYLDKLRNAIEQGGLEVRVEPSILKGDSIQSADTLRQMLDNIMDATEQTRSSLATLKNQIESFPQDRQGMTGQQLYDLTTDKIIKETSTLLSNIYNLALEMSLLQAEARANSIELPEVDMEFEEAIRIARCFRRDWMNARASLVDAWRQIEFSADQLEAQLDLVFDGNMGNVGDNPVKFRADNGTLRAGLRFDTPIVRQAERNRYRQALIQYQQARRQYYQFEDEVTRNLRQTIRAINQNKILFELSRQNIKVALDGLELARLNLDDPSATSLGPTTVINLTRNINSLQVTQNGFLNVWVQFEVLRQNLDYDLGTMQIGPDGAWLDPEVIDSSIAARAAAMMGIELDESCFCDPIYPEIMVPQSFEPTDESVAPDTDALMAPPELSSGGSTTVDQGAARVAARHLPVASKETTATPRIPLNQRFVVPRSQAGPTTQPAANSPAPTEPNRVPDSKRSLFERLKLGGSGRTTQTPKKTVSATDSGNRNQANVAESSELLAKIRSSLATNNPAAAAVTAAPERDNRSASVSRASQPQSTQSHYADALRRAGPSNGATSSVANSRSVADSRYANRELSPIRMPRSAEPANPATSMEEAAVSASTAGLASGTSMPRSDVAQVGFMTIRPLPSLPSNSGGLATSRDGGSQEPQLLNDYWKRLKNR